MLKLEVPRKKSDNIRMMNETRMISKHIDVVIAIRELAEEETAALRTRLTNIEARMRRNADVTDYEFATRNATAAIADALAIDRSEMDHRLGLIALDDAANATREAEKILEALPVFR